jgi:hypothetical protein
VIGADGARVELGIVASDGRPITLSIEPTEWSEEAARTTLRCLVQASQQPTAPIGSLRSVSRKR